MANDSSTGGYLVPVQATPPEQDADLEDIFQLLIAGMTGLSGDLVRPRWQPTVPKQPEPNVSWAAIGITSQTRDANPAITHDPAANSGNGADNFQRHETIDLLCSFYGPLGQRLGGQACDGLYVAQNSEFLHQYGIGVIGCSPLLSVPELFNEQWIRRYDVTLSFRRSLNRTYNILNILSANSQINTA